MAARAVPLRECFTSAQLSQRWRAPEGPHDVATQHNIRQYAKPRSLRLTEDITNARATNPKANPGQDEAFAVQNQRWHTTALGIRLLRLPYTG